MNPIKPTLKTEILPLLFIIISVVASFCFYSIFPEQVPIHWNVAGEADNWGSKTMGAFLFPIIILGIYLLFFILPYLDPRKARYEQFRRPYHIFKNILVAFMALIYFLSSLNILGFNLPIELYMPILVGLLFIILGNYMSKIKPNWFMGIRTPWTLSSEEVWNKTHRFSGKVFIAGGLLLMTMYWLPITWRTPLLFAIIIFIVLSTTIYSFVVYNKEQKKNPKTQITNKFQ